MTSWYFNFSTKIKLASLKTEVDKLDIDKIVPVPIDFSKVSDLVKNDVVKKAVYDKLVEKVNNIDTSGFVYDTDKTELENKIPGTSALVKKTDYNAKITRGKNTKYYWSSYNAALTAVENKRPNIKRLVRLEQRNF